MGTNAIHRASEVLGRLARHEPDVVDVDGLEYRESLQVVRIDGGIAGKFNVVPDHCAFAVGRRFAPSYTEAQAERQVRVLLDGADSIEVLQSQPAAPPNLTNPLVSGVRRDGRPARAAEARLDRRRTLRIARRARGQLRAG